MINEKCLACDKEILTEDIFMKINIDMHRLIYNQYEKEENFLVPDGPARMMAKFYLCNGCSQGLMMAAPKDLAVEIVRCKDRKVQHKR